jgi:hypothetical protein
MKMNSTKGSARARLLTSTLLAGLATIAAPLAVTAIATAVPTLASAQDYTSGTLIGTVTDSAGAPVAGATVVVKSTNTGLERSLTTGADGQFRLPLVSLGSYSVSITKADYEPLSNSNVSVRLGGESAYGFTLTKPGEVSAVVVTGAANPQLDFAATTTGLAIDLETLAKQVPLPRTIAGITLLAPGAVSGSQFANSANGARIAAQPALGGSSSAENAYYINGLNITNFATYLGGATVPFDFYKTVEVKTGGYAPEYGRATGGIINAVTKSGGNDFKFRVSGNYEPQDLREDAPSTVFYKESRRDSEQKNLTLEASGPIIEDHLFFYVLNQQQKSFTSLATNTGTNDSYTTQTRNDPFWGAKLDGYLTDRHHVELTWFDTKRQTDAVNYRYTAATDTVGALLAGTKAASTTKFDEGGASWVAKYTGSLTDWFTISAAYGITEDSDSTLPGDTTTPYIADSRQLNGVPVGTRIGTQTSSATSLLETRREFYRVDGDLYFNLLGKHHIRGGYDNEKTSLFRASVPTGGVQYEVFTGSATDAYGQPLGQDYVKTSVFVNGGTFDGENSAWYIQDSWDLLPNLNLQLGLRGDKFLAKNPDGDTFIKFSGKDTLGPRVGFNWDVFSDSSTKVSGSFGRYFLPVAANTSYRMTSGELYYSKFFKVSNVNTTTGTFTQGAQITGFATAHSCPDGSGTACEVTGDGTAADVTSFIDQGLKPTYEDEYILGIERQFNPLWKGGVRLVYRTLGQTAEDMAIDASVLAYCKANGYVMNNATSTGCADIYSGFHQYVIGNPGKGMKVTLSDVLPGDSSLKTLTFTSGQLGFPKAKREYVGLEFTFERAFDGKWGLQGSYVMSESKGNYEGAVKSDVGQLDFAITQDFDQPGLTDNSYGLLPNHRGHQFKAFGSYALTDNILFGANVSVLSPKKYGCLGRHPTDPFAPVYGASSFYCLSSSTATNYLTQSVATPRGSQFETDWRTQLDLTVKFVVPKFSWMKGDLSLRADVFNVFNSQAVIAAYERGEAANGTYDPRYMKPTGYQTPRYFRFGFDWEF